MNQVNETIKKALPVIWDRKERDGNKVLKEIVKILEARISHSTGTEDKMTNKEILEKCVEKKEEIMQEINTTPRGWMLWLMIRDNEVTWTTVTENTHMTGPVFSTWYHRPERKTWSEIQEELWMDLYNSRGDN